MEIERPTRRTAPPATERMQRAIRRSPKPWAKKSSNIGAAPIAMPMWAALSAGASFTPSPVMATTSGAALPFIDLPQDRRIRDYLASFLEPVILLNDNYQRYFRRCRNEFRYFRRFLVALLLRYHAIGGFQ